MQHVPAFFYNIRRITCKLLCQDIYHNLNCFATQAQRNHMNVHEYTCCDICIPKINHLSLPPSSKPTICCPLIPYPKGNVQ